MNEQTDQQCWLVLIIKAPVEINTGRQHHVPLQTMRQWLKKYAVPKPGGYKRYFMKELFSYLHIISWQNRRPGYWEVDMVSTNLATRESCGSQIVHSQARFLAWCSKKVMISAVWDASFQGYLTRQHLCCANKTVKYWVV